MQRKSGLAPAHNVRSSLSQAALRHCKFVARCVLFLTLLLNVSGCGREQELTDSMESSDISDSMLAEEQMMSEGEMLPGRSDPRQINGVRATKGEPFVLQVLDEEANPVLNRRLLSLSEISAGWISLFDGTTLFGWESQNPDVNWKVEDGAITADVGPEGLLTTTVPFSDFELICEFRISEGGNSGLFLRSLKHPQDLQKDCIELNIANKHPDGYTTGSFVARKKTDRIAEPSTDWQTLRVVANRGHYYVDLNGTEILAYTDTSPDARQQGFIGLQQRIGKVEFRKVVLKPSQLTSIFTGQDLEGWQVVPESKGKFIAEDGCIRVRGGTGFLETKRTYQDFLLQAVVRTGVPETNSGIFLRAEPGTAQAPSNGYEVQIHNGIHDNDRDRPNNAGSGAIFRRVEARRVVASDREWYTMSILAYGPRFAVWVDGYQVVDWVDQRPANTNPRKGLRLDAGHISLQGHDPTTDCEFRELRIQEFQKTATPIPQ